jgi:FlaG/FlaF family flagellin (archaellin)
MMMRYCRNKRGVSPVISAVIMMLVVMIGMSALFAFFVNYSRDFQEGSGSAVFESMTVEDIWFTSSDATVLWVYNFGKVDLTISSVYVDSNAVTFTPNDLTIAAGGHGKIVVYSLTTNRFVSGNSYLFKIVTERGTSFEGVYTW